MKSGSSTRPNDSERLKNKDLKKLPPFRSTSPCHFVLQRLFVVYLGHGAVGLPLVCSQRAPQAKSLLRLTISPTTVAFRFFSFFTRE